MSRMRPRLRLLFAVLLVFAAAPRADGACNATCKRDLERCIATQCEGVGQAACRRRCKPAAIRTLAYVLSECRVDAAGFVVARQALRVRRGDRDPITVVEFPPSEPMPDPRQLCRAFGGAPENSSRGEISVFAFPLQRLGVSADGSGVVFEVNDEFSIAGPTALSPEQKGIFFVRSDGRGLRRLGPPSRDPAFTASQSPPLFSVSTSMAFSPNARRVAFTDRGPGPGGEETVQIIVLDLATGRRAQVTRLPAGTASGAPGVRFLTCCPKFIDNETILFQTFVDADGSNPDHNFAAFTVGIDGSRLKRVPIPVAVPGSRVVQIFATGGGGGHLVNLILPGTVVNPVPTYYTPITEVFFQDGRTLFQLTNFHRSDTQGVFLSVGETRAFFLASADPFGTNPYVQCQFFSIDTVGGGLRQVTHFNPGGRSPFDLGCFGPLRPGCQIGGGGPSPVFGVQDPVTKAIVFDSSCDPVQANPYGDQAFAMRPDGSGLRQLTDAAGFTENADGSIRVELPGPFAYSARRD